MTRLIASWFGSGLILRRVRGSDAGSGTVASVFAFPVAIWLGGFGVLAQVGAAVVVTALAIWSVSDLVETEGDAGWIVVDEAAGTFIATVSLGWGPGLVALVIFRVADIFKAGFPGVARAEKLPGATGVVAPGVARAEKLPGATGVVADDVIAAFYGLAAGVVVQNLY